MKKKILQMVLILMTFCLLVSASYALEADNLSLYGYVKSIDLDLGRIEIDVKSDSCPGIRTFTFNTEKVKIDPGILDKRIYFVIDKNECSDLRINLVSYYVRGETK